MWWDYGRPWLWGIQTANRCKDTSRGSRRPSCRKLQAGDSVVTEMAGVHLFHTTVNVRCTIIGQRYVSLLKQSVIALQARRSDASKVFMQDGVPPHIARWLKQLFRRPFRDKRIICRQFPTAWPTRSPDLNPCDFWLCEYLKSMIYQDPITFLSDLKKKHRTPCP